MPTVPLALAEGLRVEGGAPCWLGRWRFHSRLDDDDEEPEEEDQEIRDKALPRWQIWLAAERSRDHRHWRPWRPDKARKQTEEDCEDPERQVRPFPSPSGGRLLSRPRWVSVPRRNPLPLLSPRLAQERPTCSHSRLQKHPLLGKRQDRVGCW